MSTKCKIIPKECEIMPRETIYNEAIKNRICEALRLGHFVSEAVKLAGIDEKTYYNWYNKGKAGKEPFVQFVQLVDEAQAEAIDDALDNIRKAGRDDWKAEAWFLERRRKDWLKVEKMEVSGEDNTPIEIELRWADDLGKEKEKKKENIDV